MSQGETKRGCHRHLRFRYQVQNCHGSFVQIKALLNRPLFVHPVCGLWGTGDIESMEINSAPLMSMSHNTDWDPGGFPYSPTKVLVATGRRAALSCAPGQTSVCLFYSFPATVSIQLGYSKLHGDAVMYKPLDAFTCGWQLLKPL